MRKTSTVLVGALGVLFFATSAFAATTADSRNLTSPKLAPSTSGSGLLQNSGSPAIQTVTPNANGQYVNPGGGSSGINIGQLTSYKEGILQTINFIIVPVLISLAFIVFLYGVALAYILQPDNEAARAKGHMYVLWAVIGFAVIFSVWGLVNVVGSIFGVGTGSATSQGLKPPAL